MISTSPDQDRVPAAAMGTDRREVFGARNPLSRLARMVGEDGLFVALVRMAGVCFRRTRDGLLAARLKAPGLRFGSAPKLRGLRHMRVGRSFSAGDQVWIEAVTTYRGQQYEPRIAIGDNVVMSSQIHIGATSSIAIGDGALIGSRVTIIDHNHGIYKGIGQSLPGEAPAARLLSAGRPISIGRNVWIGDGVVLLPGAEVGEGTVVGANAVVAGILPANCIAVGSPARPVRRYDADAKEWVQWTL